jgi:hypothetical protein
VRREALLIQVEVRDLHRLLLRDTHHANVGGVHGADEKSGDSDGVMGEVSSGSARCRVRS